MDKKQLQLGMNPSTASHRLVKDLLYKYAVADTGTKCFHCGKAVSREEFSVEHKTPWLDSEDPVRLFFDTENVAFSHHACNVGAARRERVTKDRKRQVWRDSKRRHYDPEVRRHKYLDKGY